MLWVVFFSQIFHLNNFIFTICECISDAPKGKIWMFVLSVRLRAFNHWKICAQRYDNEQSICQVNDSYFECKCEEMMRLVVVSILVAETNSVVVTYCCHLKFCEPKTNSYRIDERWENEMNGARVHVHHKFSTWNYSTQNYPHSPFRDDSKFAISSNGRASQQAHTSMQLRNRVNITQANSNKNKTTKPKHVWTQRKKKSAATTTCSSFINEPTNEQENESNLHLIGPYLVCYMYIAHWNPYTHMLTDWLADWRNMNKTHGMQLLKKKYFYGIIEIIIFPYARIRPDGTN